MRGKYRLLLLLVSLVLFGCTAGQTKEEMIVSHYPENPSYQDNVLITFNEEEYFKEEIERVEIQAQSLGMTEPLLMDEALHQITLAIEDHIEPGEKEVEIIVTYSDGTSETFTETINVQEKEPGNDLDFGWDEARIYFALTDRFYNGDNSNDYLVDDTNHHETYHGGDFQGLIEKMPYLADLGVNTLWITPIVDNIEWNVREPQSDAQYGYHGYWAKDFTRLDEHLGDIDTFKQLLETAHDHGIKVMVDVVLNHAGYGMKATDTNPGVKNFPVAAEQAVFEGMLRLEPVKNHPVLGELSGLPDFITEDEAVRNQLVAWQAEWIEKTKTERGDTIDFFRVDTIKHVEDTTWKAFKNKIISLKPDFKLLGENYGASIHNHGGYFHDGEMDAVLDFEFKAIAGRFVNWDVMGVQADLIERNERMTSDATMAQFLSSHDEDGFLYRLAGGDLGKQMVAAGLQLTAKGIPVIYYGEEIGLSEPAARNMDNGEYNENRYDFDWNAVETTGKRMHSHYRKLLHIRAAHSLTFAKGDRQTLGGSNQEGYLFFSRTYEGETVFVGLNILDQPTTVSVEVPFPTGTSLQDLYSGKTYTVSKQGHVELRLPPRSEGGTAILVWDE